MAYIYDIADTWNAIGTTFTAIKMNVTDTASNAASLLMDLQVGGSSKLSVSKGGSILSPLNSGLVPALATSAANDRGFGFYQNRPSILYGGTVALSMPNALTIGLNSTTTIGWGAGNPIDSTIDTILARDAANTLAQRNSTNPQAFNLYNTYTDASNYERGYMRFVGNELQIGAEAAGSGGFRSVRINMGVSGILLTRYINNTNNSLTMFDFTADGTGTTTYANGGTAPLLRFGGTSSAAPALKRSTTSMQVRLADDSAFTNIQGKLTTDTAYTAGAPTATGYIVLFDSTGTAYRVPAVAN